MKRMKSRMKKGMAVLLAAIMLVGLMPMMPYDMATVYAAGTPSATAYATRDDLMNWSYDTTVGKIVFGKDSNGDPLEWYILGSDSGVKGKNTAIFATSPVNNTLFDPYLITSSKSYNEGDGVYANGNPSEVYPNHYGASDLRATLKGMVDAGNETYFTSAEKSLMQPTTVTTTDIMNNNKSYTTTDVLYALHGVYSSINDADKTLYAGSNNGKALPLSTYWSTGDWFWLRSADTDRSDNALIADPGMYVSRSRVYDNSLWGVQPASNLNLSSVIFASAATVAPSENVVAGVIQSDKAMRLRLDGSNVNIGNVIYDSTKGEMIFVEKSSEAQGTVSLVVQGKDGNNDWYYSKAVTGDEIINMSEIKSTLSLSDDISVSDCKIWLETTINGVIYAKTLTTVSYTEIDRVDLFIDAPVAGNALDTQAETPQSGLTTNTPAVTWKAGTADVTGNADYGTVYTAYTTLEATDTSFFASSVIAKVNGNPATVVTNNDGTITVSYTFPATEDKDQLISITQPDEVPHTGDTSSPMIPFILMMVSLLCMSMLIVYGRIGNKYEQNQKKR
ncbi:MAG: hypothetical protein IIX45_01645 [Lachnospiraceae bacterium]|nr:hypothetical protein [Lachnospiraceae bacterium]